MEFAEKIGDYVVERVLGSGSCGKVKLARNMQTGQFAAIKIIKKSFFESKPNIKEKIQREVAVMRIFKHSRLLKLLEICESPHHIYLVLEYASNGELFDYLISRGCLSEAEAMHFFRQIIFGIDFLHSRSICHRDIKPENLLLDEHNNIKIADFGFARIASSDPLTTYCGSIYYAAPEIVNGVPYHGFPADIWSCGIVLYTLLTGKLPFQDPAYRKTVEKIKSGHYVMPDVSDPINDLLANCLNSDPNSRFTTAQIKAHPAFRIGLPEDYILPKPLPIPFYSDPILREELDHNAIITLTQMGYSSQEEIESQLQTQGSSMAKVLYFMLITQGSIDSLPWQFTENQDMMMPMDNSGMEMESNQVFGAGSLDSYGRRRQNTYDVSSPEVYSLATRAQWGNFPNKEYPQEVVQPFVDIQLPAEVILAHMQQLLSNLCFKWFHPDDMTIIARRLEDRATIVVTLEYTAEEWITMNLSYSEIEQSEIYVLNDTVLNMLSEF
ncbi:CAMK family protein kinase [Trichomonas vaginalis G3]|uniref:CAMK family protein kinase n=1 Tax=Trichomonas vaginalis (strain ATCC PRA-98 / G3) TaxID=412133 RepID=A2FGW3_TRIV3|nr:protein serine/threonine kinase protein [Trichomonas vaginalis G3]EAX95867.1 CAMK family protein kinase [Trichomonas vaginalis G3]KAI5488685.1 protein serine/threonine kinase protein [Trichomonas vaginalis G3]|eukprot:XP_001308797.1 CAMK family protein kinase [Trichomonas vaginalis G3]